MFGVRQYETSILCATLVGWRGKLGSTLAMVLLLLCACGKTFSADSPNAGTSAPANPESVAPVVWLAAGRDTV